MDSNSKIMEHESSDIIQSDTKPLSDKTIEKPNNIQENYSWSCTAKDAEWHKIILIVVIHLITFYGLITFPYSRSWRTCIWIIIVSFFTGMGITIGAHRYWSHKSFKATLPMKIMMTLAFVTTLQMKPRKWVSYHRTHHKYSETEADPHNAKRGFVFSHIGWALIKRPPLVVKRLKEVDLSDLSADPVFNFAEKYYELIATVMTVILVAIPMYFWDELLYYSVLGQFGRYTYVLNASSCVNSFAHLWGNKPYNKNIGPAESVIANTFSLGEGSHNYHHTFPNDYRSAEFGYSFDISGAIIRNFKKIGWTYDLKRSSDSLVKMTMDRRGDGTLNFQPAKEIHSS